VADYVFVFLGEFGFELLNWQAVVRKFARSCEPGDRIVCAGRTGVSHLYERAHAYIDISANERYRSSRASCYGAVPEPLTGLLPRHGRPVARFLMDREIRRGLRQGAQGPFRIERGDWATAEQCIRSAQSTWTFSWKKTWLGECRFGADMYSLARRTRRFRLDGEGGIYGSLDAANNEYMKFEPVLSERSALEERLGFSLEEPYVLIQGRQRETPQLSSETLATEPVIAALARHARVVSLDFETGRAKDSYSRLSSGLPNVVSVSASSLAPQSCLIHFARSCVFFTEGDLGSHAYLPPLMGKDVWVVAPPSVFGLDSSPLEFWNENVFTFGGQIRPVAMGGGAGARRVLASEDDLRRFAQDVTLSRT